MSQLIASSNYKLIQLFTVLTYINIVIENTEFLYSVYTLQAMNLSFATIVTTITKFCSYWKHLIIFNRTRFKIFIRFYIENEYN